VTLMPREETENVCSHWTRTFSARSRSPLVIGRQV
jgi:hypothetical protein